MSRLDRQGETSLGATSPAREADIKAKDVFVPSALALLFCDEHSREVCTAIRLDGTFLRGFYEFSVQLPVAETVDRVRASPEGSDR